jgi:hypothetical protein
MAGVYLLPSAEEALNPTARESEDFSLVLGGPLYQLLLRTRFITPPFGNLGWRIAVITGLAWLPLVVLTLAGGRFAGGVQVPFLYDFEVHARLLFAVPLMVLAELVVHVRMRAIARQFIERHIITDKVRAQFDAALSSAMRLRNSVAVELAILLVVAIAGPWIWRSAVALSSNAWSASVGGGGPIPTAAGRWYVFVSVPIFQFLLLRWYFRIIIWWRFLFQVSRLDLNLVPLHPDRCCGLGFLGNVAAAFAPLLMAHTGVLSGFIANRILHDGASLPAYKFEIAAMAAFLLLVVLGPLCVFVPVLNRARLAGLRTYGRLASDYVVDFASKWTGDAPTASEPLLGTSDLQSMADLDSSFEIVQQIKLVPFSIQGVVRFLVVIGIPLAPLALTMFSVEELMEHLVKLVL